MTPPNIEAVRKALKFAEVERRENCETPHSVRSMTEWYHLPAIIVNRWYEGPVPCEFCHCTMHLLIGGWNRSGNKRTEPFEGSNGGKLLEPATLVMEANAIPTIMTDGIGSNVPESIREAFDTATHHFNRLDYTDAAVRCRFTLEAALMERGISRDRLPVMADQARSEALVTELVKNFCVVVAGIGGDAVHPQTNAVRYVGRNDALLAIDATANVLRKLYPRTGSY